VKLPVVGSAHGHGELIADLPSERTKLGKAQVMGVWRYTAADETGVLPDELEVLLVPDSLGLGEGQDAFVDRRSRLRSARIAASPRFLPIDSICRLHADVGRTSRRRGRIAAGGRPRGRGRGDHRRGGIGIGQWDGIPSDVDGRGGGSCAEFAQPARKGGLDRQRVVGRETILERQGTMRPDGDCKLTKSGDLLV